MADNFLKEVALVPNQTYNYSNSSVFYSLVNYSYQNYYKQVIEISQQWLDGYVPAFHKAKNGIFSSRIAAKISKGITNQIFGRGLVFVNGKNTLSQKGLDFISHTWVDKCNFQNVVKQMLGFTSSLGTGLIKLNKSMDAELWAEALRIDYFWFSVDGKGDLYDITTFVRSFQSVNKPDVNYCLVEKRYFKEEHPKFSHDVNGESVEFEDKSKCIKVPYSVYRVYEINSTSNNNSLSVNRGKGKDYKTLPEDVKNALRENYSAIILDKEIKLPFHENLGCFLFKNEGGDITHPSLPFGTPFMFDLISSFMEYDMEVSYSIRDLYNSKGIVGVPKALTQSAIVPGTQGGRSDTPYSQLNIAGYEYVSGLDPNTQKPIINQFEMRAVEHEAKQNAILKSIATAIGMSPRVIASYLVNGNEKTAEQTHSEDDTITNWVKVHRQDYISGLNEIIETVLSYYGIIDNVEVRFASDGLISNERQLEILQKKMELGLIDLEDAVREIYPDLDEEQLKVKIAKAKKQKELNEQQQQKEFDEMYGDSIGDDNGEETENEFVQ